MGTAARRVAFAFVAAASAAWLAALVAAPMTLARPDAPLSARGTALAVHVAGGFVCHQLPHRSFHISGVPMPVCARCTGLYVGSLVGLLLGGTSTRIGRRALQSPAAWLAIAALPTLGSVVVEWGTGLTSALSRAGAAIPLGAGVAAIVAAALQPQPAAANRSATLP